MNAVEELTKSLWMEAAVMPSAPELEDGTTTDVVVIGSGIAGLSSAFELQRAGLRVVVVDRGEIGGGHSEAIDRIESIQESEGVDCHFKRLNGYLFPAQESDNDVIDKQFNAAKDIGIIARTRDGDIRFGVPGNAPMICFPNQARFHPRLYLRGLCERLAATGTPIYSNSPVVEVKEEGEGVVLRTTRGALIHAAHAIVATNSPINDRVAIHSKQAPYRTYVIALELPGDVLEDALYWDTADPYHYVRLEPSGSGYDWLIVGGEDHKSGEADDGPSRFHALEDWIRDRVPRVGEVAYRWSGQYMDTLDFAAYSGVNPGNSRVYVHTGDSGQGLTHGVLASLNFKSLITTGKACWDNLYDPARIPLRGTGAFISENASVAKNFLGYLTPGEIGSADELMTGTGAIMREGTSKIAVFRDESGEIIRRSAACTHLGCLVSWNSTEKCWDCACHGSQFSPDGKVLHGPAIHDLPEA
jgi:glycine/D-amino acid oxidase-like deaminating enzyme/nitrite reductase/ring-hydroxylating ferredoxin subunit